MHDSITRQTSPAGQSDDDVCDDDVCDDDVEAHTPASATGRPHDVDRAPHAARMSFEFLAGVLLPGIAFLVEISTRMCANTFFDPMPTRVHQLLVAMVPGVNLFLMFRPVAGEAPIRPAVLWVNGVTISVSCIYSLVFLPLMPLAIMAILFMGMGLLPLSPVFAVLAGWSIRQRLKENLAKPVSSPVPIIIPAFGIALTLVLVPDLPDVLTRSCLNRAVDGSQEARADSIMFLRKYGHDESLLTYCYRSSDFRTGDDFLGQTPAMRISNLIPCNVTPEQAREVFYRVTGKAFNSVPPPSSDVSWWSGNDEGLGGTAVGGHLENLLLSNSRLDVAIDTNSLVAYTEWTLLFQNSAPWEQEARAQIQLPPGGVVSRLTLWINGEPCEAAFGGSGSVRKAYQEVAVVQRRDPVLVTYAGIDRVLMQCFPVPSGGSMQVRVGITAPVVPTTEQLAPLALPCLNETNFQAAAVHTTWITGANVTGRGVNRVGGGQQASWNNEEFATATDLRIELPSVPKLVQTVDPVDDQRVISQHVLQNGPETPTSIVAVVDGSLSMHPHFDVVAAALSGLQEESPSQAGPEIHLVVAGDQVLQSDHSAVMSESTLLQSIRNGAADGGCDNLPGLIAAWDIAVRTGANDILWFHGPQPVSMSSADVLAQRLEYADAGITIHSLSTGSGPNRILELLPAGADIQTSRAQLDSLSQQVSQLLNNSGFSVERTATPVSEDAVAELNGSDHLARLWANEEVHRALQSRQPEKREQAAMLAVTHSIVSPVSGAVVLENQAQYDAAGLKPGDPHSVPTIPEPEVWLLLVMALILVVVLVVREARSRPV